MTYAVTMGSPQYGPVETAARALVKGLGRLSAWQTVACEAFVRLSGLLDVEPDGNKAAALSRELRLTLARLVPASADGSSVTDSGDAVSRVRDQLAERRAKMNG